MSKYSSPQQYWAPKPVEYGGDQQVKVLTVEGQPIVLFAKGVDGLVRHDFVAQIVRNLYGTRPDGRKHSWEFVPLAPVVPPAVPDVEVPELEKQGVHDWLVDKVTNDKGYS